MKTVKIQRRFQYPAGVAASRQNAANLLPLSQRMRRSAETPLRALGRGDGA